MMTFDEAVEKTSTLKDLDRVQGTEKHKDYFVVQRTDLAQFCLKVDFAKNILGQPYGFFARVRIVCPPNQDIGNMEALLNEGKFGDRKTIEKKITKKPIKAKYLKCDQVRLSFVIESKSTLNDYGDPSTLEGWDALVEALKADLAAMGNRVYEALLAFNVEPDEMYRMLIQGCMRDYANMFKPIKPEEDPKGKQSNVVPLPGQESETPDFKGAAEQILSDLHGKDIKIEFKGDPSEEPPKK